MCSHRLFHHLHPQIDVVVADGRGDDPDVGVGSYAIFKAPDTLAQVVRAGDAGENRHLALLIHRAHQEVCGGLPRLVVINPQVREAPTLGRIGVPRHHRYAGCHGLVDRVDAGDGVVARDGNGIHVTRNNVFYHPHLFGGVGGHRAHVQHFYLNRPAGRQFRCLLNSTLPA